jgi:pilus assembly protein FimV
LEKIIMPRRLVRFSLALIVFLSSQAFALGLGEIRVNSALNEPLEADIELLSATPDELFALKVVLASEESFEQSGLDRPSYLTALDFQVVQSGSSTGNYVRVSSSEPITEPFLTFLIEATWSSGRLIREYTVLLDPPTFAPPAASQPAPAVTAPQRADPADSGRIERTPPPAEATDPAPTPVPLPVQPAETVEEASSTPAAPPEPVAAETVASEPEPAASPEPVVDAVVDDEPYSTTVGGDVVVQRGDTLWGIASRMRPDSRLSVNQTMLAIFEANPAAFEGNINRLRAGASLRMPSADDIFRIDRAEAFREAERQHAEYDSSYVSAAESGPEQAAETQPEPAAASEPSLQLVPPDEDLTAAPTGTDSAAEGEPLTREQEVLDRIAELEAEGVTSDPALIEIRDNELASLREELARIRGEVYEPPVEAEDPFADTAATDDPFADESAVTDAEEPASAAEDDAATVQTTPVSRRAPTLTDTILGWLTSIYAKIGAIVLIAVGVLLWFLRRGKGEEDPDSWQPLAPDDAAADDFAATGALQPLDGHDETIVVEEEPPLGASDPTIESPAVAAGDDQTAAFGSFEDTLSSETAVNLDESDPIAEADFHMAYGLYDQAADLVNAALKAEPDRQDLISKLCEVYFVWGNRDAFTDAAARLKQAIGGGESAEWDKIVIMGQQIAGDHDLFAGAGTAAATQKMDISLGADDGGTGALDMEFGEDDDGEDVIDLGAESEGLAAAGDDGVDFLFDQVGSSTNDSNIIDMDFESMAGASEAEDAEDSGASRESDQVASVIESPTIEEQFDISAIDDLPSTDDTEDAPETAAVASGGSDATAEIDLNDLDLDISGLDETEADTLGDLDVTGTNEALLDTGISEALTEAAETAEESTEVDTEVSAENPLLDDDIDEMDLGDAFDVDDVLSRTGTMRLAPDETGVNPMVMPVEEPGAAGIDDMLAATGRTTVLPEDFAVETTSEGDLLLGDDEVTLLAGLDDDESPGDDLENEEDEAVEATVALGNDDATLLAGLDDDEDDFDFAKTEALPVDAFAGADSGIDETGEMPIASPDADLDVDLNDLTAALEVSVGGDTVEMPRNEATVEQPRPDFEELVSSTLSLDSDEMGDDFDDDRTMTEVGTKLDLARAYVDMGDPGGARSILEEVLDEGDEGQRQQARSLLDSLPAA